MIDFILSLIPGGGLTAWLAAGVAAILGAVGLYFKGRSDAKAKSDLKDLRGFKETTERMQDADAAFGDDPAILRERLRKRDPDKR